jgi:hypothetical protein
MAKQQLEINGVTIVGKFDFNLMVGEKEKNTRIVLFDKDDIKNVSNIFANSSPDTITIELFKVDDSDNKTKELTIETSNEYGLRIEIEDDVYRARIMETSINFIWE